MRKRYKRVPMPGGTPPSGPIGFGLDEIIATIDEQSPGFTSELRSQLPERLRYLVPEASQPVNAPNAQSSNQDASETVIESEEEPWFAGADMSDPIPEDKLVDLQ